MRSNSSASNWVAVERFLWTDSLSPREETLVAGRYNPFGCDDNNTDENREVRDWRSKITRVDRSSVEFFCWISEMFNWKERIEKRQ